MFDGKVLCCRIHIIGNFSWCPVVWDIGTSIDVTNKTNKTNEAYVVCRISNTCMYIFVFVLWLLQSCLQLRLLRILRFFTIRYYETMVCCGCIKKSLCLWFWNIRITYQFRWPHGNEFFSADMALELCCVKPKHEIKVGL